MQRFFSGIYQGITSRWYISVLSTMIFVFVGSAKELIRVFHQETLLSAEYHMIFIKTALSSDAVTSLLPIVAALPFAGAYVDEIKSKFVRFYLIRSNYRYYILNRSLVCFLYGGGAAFLGGLLSWGISTLLFMPLEMAAEEGAISTVSIWPILVLLFLAGGLWAIAGMAISTFMESKYIAYASPFVMYYMLVILCERYIPDVFLLYPPNWTQPDSWPYGVWGAAFFLLELTIAFGILFLIRAGRRLREL